LIPQKIILKESYKIFTDAGHDGLEEVKLFKENMQKTCCPIRYKLILTDLNMPNLDGFGAATEILKY